MLRHATLARSATVMSSADALDVCENTPQSSVIQPVWRLYWRVARVVREPVIVIGAAL
jgi:hypothetical protein